MVQISGMAKIVFTYSKLNVRVSKNFIARTCFTIILITLFSVRGQIAFGQQMAYAEKFVSYLKANDQKGIYALAYHTHEKNNITNKANRIKYVKQASDLINKWGVVPSKKWICRVNFSSNIEAYQVEVPLWSIDAKDSSKVPLGYIVITFPPKQISDRMDNFYIELFKDSDGKQLQAPVLQKPH
jgi:hypothetical protein